MENTDIRRLLEEYKNGTMTMEDAVHQIRNESIFDMGFAKLDVDRKKRQGFPEVVFCEGKDLHHAQEILSLLLKKYPNIIGTRASQELYDRLRPAFPALQYHPLSRLLYQHTDHTIINGERIISVITAGTSDIAIAEEAALTAEIMGNQVNRIYDVGVAGLHRLLVHLTEIRAANVNIVIAGMEGALASVVGGLVDKPVVAVPTSIGYGANLHGLSALLAMLNSCAAGVGVVNIDNGFGAGRLAHIINSQR